MLDSLLTEDQAAKRLAISGRTLRKLRQEGLVHYIRIRTSIRYAPEDLERYVESVRKCQSISAPARPIGGMTSRSTVADFEEARKRKMRERRA